MHLTKVICGHCVKIIDPPKRYKVFDWIADWNSSYETDIRINILPIAHPQLNLIEQIWNWTKDYVKSNNHDISMRSVEKLIAEIDREWWRKACQGSHEFALGYQEVNEMDRMKMERTHTIPMLQLTWQRSIFQLVTQCPVVHALDDLQANWTNIVLSLPYAINAIQNF